MSKLTLPVLLLFLISSQTIARQPEIKLDSGWKARKAIDLTVDGTVISGKDFQLTGWMDAVVPGTVLTTLLHNGQIPDPFFGLNNELIPDISKTGPDYYTYWFINGFTLPDIQEGEQVWLKFRGINYSAEMFLNGRKINPDTHEGMFLRAKYLITPFLEKGTNRLAVLVRPPDPPGTPGGQGGDGLIGRSVTMQFTAGWDWICPMRDRNTGIWDEVSVEITGPVDLLDPHVVTRVPGKRIPTGQQEPAIIQSAADLLNVSGEKQTGKLVARCGNYEVSKSVEIPAGKKITTDLPDIKLENPQLWWPNGMGDHPLYKMEFSFVLTNDRLSDKESVSFGIRETGTRYSEDLTGRIFMVNGQDVFIKGGNWIASDALLRLSPGRYEAEVKMHAEMNMNMIRVWGGGLTERPEFYDACDKYGILVWQDLWISGDCNGRWPDATKKESRERRRAYPDLHSLFMLSVIDQVKMLRNHPGLYLWCGGNEFPPPPDIDQKLRNEIFPEYDGTRYYLNESTSADLALNKTSGTADGPYGIQNPSRFFTVTSFAFNPELGSVGMPNAETLRRIMDEKDLVVPAGRRENEVWRYHKYLGYDNFIDQYGKPAGIDDFCKKAQLVNYEQYRALQEGFNAGMWNKYSGMLVWKNQNPWTALRGQFYDVFLDQNGGFYGFRHGAKPLHLQLNLDDSTVCLVNQTFQAEKELKAKVELFDIHGKSISEETYPCPVAANTISGLKRIDFSGIRDDVCFLRLKLLNAENQVLDENFYWLAKPGKSYEKLNDLKPVNLQLNYNQNVAVVSNPTGETAFFIRMKAVDQKSGELLLPLFLSDNYFSLLPGEKKEIKIDTSLLPEPVKSKSMLLVTEGWNVAAISVRID
jgi:mannosylglycoprotein endo-beta-mannosidase